MKVSMASFVVVGSLAGLVGSVGAEGPSATSLHRGTGIVLALEPGTITLREGEESHAMTINASTRIVLTSERRVSRIGAGDYIGEECAPDARGGATALRLTLYRPAWMEHASPEN